MRPIAYARIRDVNDPPSEINAEDLTRRGFYLYVFGKFLEYSIVVLFLFIDATVIPGIPLYFLAGKVAYGIIYAIILIVPLEIISIFYETKFYFRMKDRLDYKKYTKQREEFQTK